MMFFRAVAWVAMACCLMAPLSSAAQETPAPAVPSADELNLDRLISVYEDVALALSGVDDSTDANLVASRVAADFLLLRGMGQAMSGSTGASDVSSDTMRSFGLRREQARAAVESATKRLRENSCYGSEALPAALSLSGLMSGKSLSGPAAETAVQELLANNREMVSLLIDEATDAASAEQVAQLISSAMKCELALAAYAKELGDASLDAEQKEFFAARHRDFYIDLQNHRERLEPHDYFSSAYLRLFVEGMLGDGNGNVEE